MALACGPSLQTLASASYGSISRNITQRRLGSDPSLVSHQVFVSSKDMSPLLAL